MQNTKTEQSSNSSIQSEIKDPFKIFTLEQIGISSQNFINTLLPTFNQANWDYYDVRREQIAILKEYHTNLSEGENKRLIDFYSGAISLDSINDLYSNLPEQSKQRFDNLKPYRRRFVSEFEVCKEGQNKWFISKGREQSFSQRVSNADLRSVPRIFEPISESITELSDFRKLLHQIASMVENVREAAKELSITCWHTSVLATRERVGSNSPEGIHQDGADYIVSALVMERKNIKGGTSRIFGPDKKTEFLSHTLKPGEGIFQADAGSSLWHDVTPIAVAEPESGIGVRNLLGFDIQVKS